ncbi:hypothetical protein [Streptomyces millisiae]|uniref:Uncharacterized protein n=1 Tax=Streptomyces millisiae TaxID=3075542 RepID=A0ABU2LMI7_9ACTN|nr:hypothetical protein [Streptomyces sp. DSM 44918]MDT0318804.1 hypothetical protein [Streptomyces sp. DSM 44918]
MTDDGDGPGPVQASRIGPLGALFLYSLSVALVGSGPVMLVGAVLAGAGLLIGGVLCTVLCTPLGLVIWFSTSHERENNRRLDAAGVAATAEVTSLTDWDDGESTGVVVGLRVSGPGFRTFESTWKRSHHPALRVGLRLGAVVDPADNLFRVDL